MQKRKLGKSNLEVSALGFGCMSMTSGYGPPADKHEMIALIRHAVELGVTLFDTAEAYGPFASEELVGEALAPVRNQVVISTKFGFDIDPNSGERRSGVNSRPEHVRTVAEASLRRLLAILVLLFAGHPLMAQQTDAATSASGESTPERVNLYYQATSIGQYHGVFNSPYGGTFSFQNYAERDVSLTTTLFLGLRLNNRAQLYFDPEIAGGKGLSGVNGIANAPNGEMPRVATATPKPYLARLYLSYDFGFGSEKEHIDSDPNHLKGERPMKRYTITIGRFSITDFFDNNRYTHDPRTQFMAWGVMYNGAWDYPADTRGYTWGMVHEFHTRNWSLRYGSTAEPKNANGLRFDRRVFRDRGDVVEGERRYSAGAHPGAIRLLGYINHADSGDYGEALALSSQTGATPDITAVRRVGSRKYGAGLNLEQEVTHDIGVFARLGWNDGKTQDFAFTAIDRLVSGGIAVQGTKWKRNADVAGTSLTSSGISGVHANYLAHGGLDFNIGDGALNYSREFAWETYYRARILPGFFATYDVQRIANPAYNRDRGPVLILGLRLHLEFALKAERRR